MTANKMPEMPEAEVQWQYRERLEGKPYWSRWKNCSTEMASTFLSSPRMAEWNYEVRTLYTADQMRAMYLAGIAAARECVPAMKFREVGGGDDEWSRVAGHNVCRDQTLANLSALEQGVGK